MFAQNTYNSHCKIINFIDFKPNYKANNKNPNMIWLPSPRHPSCDFIWGWTTIYATCPNSLFHIPTYDLDSVRVCPTRLKKSTFVAPTPTKITETLEWALMNRRPWMHHACDRTRPIHTAPMMRIKLQRIHRPHPKFRNDKCYPSTQYVGWW